MISISRWRHEGVGQPGNREPQESLLGSLGPQSPLRSPPHLDAVLLFAVFIVGDGEAQRVSSTFNQHQRGALGAENKRTKQEGRGPQPFETVSEGWSPGKAGRKMRKQGPQGKRSQQKEDRRVTGM